MRPVVVFYEVLGDISYKENSLRFTKAEAATLKAEAQKAHKVISKPRIAHR